MRFNPEGRWNEFNGIQHCDRTTGAKARVQVDGGIEHSCWLSEGISSLWLRLLRLQSAVSCAPAPPPSPPCEALRSGGRGTAPFSAATDCLRATRNERPCGGFMLCEDR
ncbi:unnamed protein product [Gadus morhua 'NCC']